ncbi:CapA family protein [Paenibacillus pini]|uniref:Capsule biosynthesis protein capA n=1 Tax=Paenibacillus pini JCM 16418 TaxID=1236976 RepID=W7YT38_9BACL|nr:CapA family protein [Paenibacillus pini]GAF10358.1 capsule biosynthesis protein capA [Paenibacillus pini JCM 16418]
MHLSLRHYIKRTTTVGMIFILIILALIENTYLLNPKLEQAVSTSSGNGHTIESRAVVSVDQMTHITFAAAGDIMFHSPQLISGYDSKSGTYDFKAVFQEVQPIISAADIAIANFETTTAGTANGKYTGYPQFNSPDSVVDAIKYAGFDVLSTANNHSLDMGSKGLIRTVKTIQKRMLDNVGTYIQKPRSRVLLKEVKGVKMAFLSYTESTNGLDKKLTPAERDSLINILDEDKIKEDIWYAKQNKADLIVAFMHWGVEYDNEPSINQKRLAASFAKGGVDIILGSHPHVIQKSEQLKQTGSTSFVIYSMGNFISNQRYETMSNEATEGGIILVFDIQKNLETNQTMIKHVRYVPTWVYRSEKKSDSKYTYRIIPEGTTEFAKILSKGNQQRMKQSYTATVAKMDQQSFTDVALQSRYPKGNVALQW